jgi:multidrug resistance efflux pump
MTATSPPLLLNHPPQARPLAGAITEALAGALQSEVRRRLFRGIRLLLAGGLGVGAAYLLQRQLTEVRSDQAFLNAPLTALRASIGGELNMEPLAPGVMVRRGEPVFRVENPRFGNLEAMSQLNWIQELADRLRAESAEAELRHARQEQIFQHHAGLFQEKLISRLDYLEEEAKVALCQSAVAQKREQLRAAEARRAEVERHLALQQQAVTTMPFDGVIWSVRSQHGGEVGAQETVLHVLDPRRAWVDAFLHEKHVDKFRTGTAVLIRAVDSRETWRGRVDSVRAGVGRMDPESCVAAPAGDLSRRRIAVRVKLDSPPPFSASQFFGIGRSVVVTLADHE